MKACNKIKFLALLIAVILGIFAYESCSHDSDSLRGNRAATTPITLKKANDFEGLFKFPKGTVLTIAGGSLHFTLPGGFRLIAKLKSTANRYGYGESSAASRVVGFSDGSVNCICESGSGGCSPYVRGDNSGCESDGRCTKCTLTIGGESSRAGSEIRIKEAVVEDAAVVDLNADTQLVTKKKSLSLYRSPKGFVFADQAVRDSMQHFMAAFNAPKDAEILNEIPMGESLPAGYCYMPVALFSKYLVLMPLNLEHPYYLETHPNDDWAVIGFGLAFMDNDIFGDFERFSDIEKSFSTGTKYHCTCNSGESGCKLSRMWTPKGTIRYCESESCTDCTLSW